MVTCGEYRFARVRIRTFHPDGLNTTLSRRTKEQQLVVACQFIFVECMQAPNGEDLCRRHPGADIVTWKPCRGWEAEASGFSEFEPRHVVCPTSVRIRPFRTRCWKRLSQTIRWPGICNWLERRFMQVINFPYGSEFSFEIIPQLQFSMRGC